MTEKRTIDPATLERGARRLLAIAPERCGPADLMALVEDDPKLRRGYLELQAEVVREAMRIRRSREEEAGGSEGLDATPDRIREWLRIQFERDPEIRLGDAYDLAREELGIGITRGSFETGYFYAVRKEVREAKNEEEAGVSEVPPPTEGASEPAGEGRDAPSESPAPAPSQDPQKEVDRAIEEAAAQATRGNGRRLIEFRGRDGKFLAEERPDGRWRLAVDVETDDEVVDEVAGYLFPLLTGIAKERAS